jgi:hypothetical protein
MQEKQTKNQKQRKDKLLEKDKQKGEEDREKNKQQARNKQRAGNKQWAGNEQQTGNKQQSEDELRVGSKQQIGNGQRSGEGRQVGNEQQNEDNQQAGSERVVYFYDLKFKTKKQFNRVKRVFYYKLNKLAISNDAYKTKSTIIVGKKHELLLDAFFRNFNGSIEVYKATVIDLIELSY